MSFGGGANTIYLFEISGTYSPVKSLKYLGPIPPLKDIKTRFVVPGLLVWIMDYISIHLHLVCAQTTKATRDRCELFRIKIKVI